MLKTKNFNSFHSLDEKLINRATNLLDGLNIEMTLNEEVLSMFLIKLFCYKKIKVIIFTK